MTDLGGAYRAYIACLNARDWASLAAHVHEDAQRNGERLGVEGYRAMLESDVRAIPDLVFNIELLAVDPPYVAARLRFDCSPAGMFLGLPVNGARVSFTENVFYEYREGRIFEVWSVLDKTAIELQLLDRL